MGRRLKRRAGGPCRIDRHGGLGSHLGRRSRALLTLVAAEALLAAGLALPAATPAGGEARSAAEAARRSNRDLVSALALTDLALFSGASQTRHPSQADRFAPFADHPAALDRTPAGSVVPAPRVPEIQLPEARPPETRP